MVLHKMDKYYHQLIQTHSILTSEFLFYILSSEQSAYFLQFVQLEGQTYTFLCPLLQHEQKRICQVWNLKSHLLRSICLLVNFRTCCAGQGVLNRVKFCVSSNCSHQCP